MLCGSEKGEAWAACGGAWGVSAVKSPTRQGWVCNHAYTWFLLATPYEPAYVSLSVG